MSDECEVCGDRAAGTDPSTGITLCACCLDLANHQWGTAA